MVKLTLVSSGKQQLAHRVSPNEGESVRRLLEAQGFVVKKKSGGQYSSPCPFHEEPGEVPPRKSPNFYVNAESGLWTCMSASCGERGNLRSLERRFGIDCEDDSFVQAAQGREFTLTLYQSALTHDLRGPFYRQGLTDATIERFRLGYDAAKKRYIIPYLDGRRPRYFRYYAPDGDPKWKYTWEEGSEASMFNAQDGFGDGDGRVFFCESEIKAMLLVQMGYAAVGVPGAGQWRPEWLSHFSNARQIVVCFDNDNPLFHNYDNVASGKKCHKCAGNKLPECAGHNPGQEAAEKRVQQLGWRARNVILPLPDKETRKTDINEYFMRDGNTNADFAELVTGKRSTPYLVPSLADINADPPEEAVFLVEQGILPRGGRLLISGAPKVGKSIMVNTLALSLASGIPWLKCGDFPGFAVDHPTRTLLLDRELSRHSLYKRLKELTAHRPGFQAAAENLLIDHDHLIRLDQPESYVTLQQLIEQNGVEVVILDTAYKFFGGDVESSKSIMKGFDVLDRLIHSTGVSFILTHHHRKGQPGQGRAADPDSVAGSFLWTGWPNGTILLNFMNRSVADPFNAVATFTAFRDAAPPEPVSLGRSRESIAYNSVSAYTHEDGGEKNERSSERIPLNVNTLSEYLLDACPVKESDILHMGAAYFRVTMHVLKPYLIDVLSRGGFEKSGRPAVINIKGAEAPETWEQEHTRGASSVKSMSMFGEVND